MIFNDGKYDYHSGDVFVFLDGFHQHSDIQFDHKQCASGLRSTVFWTLVWPAIHGDLTRKDTTVQGIFSKEGLHDEIEKVEMLKSDKQY